MLISSVLFQMFGLKKANVQVEVLSGYHLGLVPTALDNPCVTVAV